MELSFLSVLAAAIAGFITGNLWFMPRTFGNTWMRLGKITPNPERMKGINMVYTMGAAFVVQFVMAWVLGLVMYWMGAYDIASALSVAFWMWLGFVATILFGNVLWESRPLKFYAIVAGGWLVTMIVMSIVLILLG